MKDIDNKIFVCHTFRDSSEYTMLQLLCKREVNLSMADSINWNNFEDFIVNVSL